MIAAVRLAVAVLGVASAIWLMPASVHIAAWPPGGPVRIAFVPPLLRFWIALTAAGLAAAAAAWIGRARQRSLDDVARAAAPLGLLLSWVVPFLPWLPDRAPLLLLLAGPLRWGVAAAAVVASAVACLRRPASRATRPFALSRATVFVLSLVLYTALGLRFASQVGFSGDEPHYLIITHSLLADRDLDIANNHARRDYRAFFAGDLRPDFLRRGLHGEIYSIHAPGLPAILLPAYAVAGAFGAIVLVAVLGALAALAIFDAAALVAGVSAATVTWLAVAFTVPFVPHAWLIYPEIPGALVVAWGVRRWWTPSTTVPGTALYAAALALLPWLHTKFVVFLALFAIVELWRLWPRARQIAAFLAPIAVSGAAWLYSFYRMYGVFDPEAPYGSYTRTFVLAQNIPRGALGLLFDQKFGLLVYSPVYVLALVGLWLMLRDAKQRLYACVAAGIAFAYFISSTRLYMWWGGTSAPARFLVPLAPLMAPAIAAAVARLRGPAGRAAVVFTIVLSLGIAAIAVGSPRESLLYSEPHGTAAIAATMQGSAPLDASWPTFTEEDWRTPVGLLGPWLLAMLVAVLTTAIAARSHALTSSFWIGAAACAVFALSGSLLVGRPAPAARAAAAGRGQLALVHDYDPTRLHAFDCTEVRRLSDADVRRLTTLAIRRAPGESDARRTEGPILLPEGRYQARFWFDGGVPADAEASITLSNRVVLARVNAAASNPVEISFELPIGAPVHFGATAGTWRLVEVSPLSIVPRSARTNRPAHFAEPIGGSVPGFIAYLDDSTFPENGVFWTRGTERGTVAIATAGASRLRLILHVGPNGGPVVVETPGRRLDLDLVPDQTREVDVPITRGEASATVSVRAARAFRPAEVDHGSDDQRSLGCQVRPQLY